MKYMRIVQVSDIHLSKDNYLYFINDYRGAILNDLKIYNADITIDLIIITGDLVDKGGTSLFEIEGFENRDIYKTPYHVFKEVFLKPIVDELDIPYSKILFIPGNHDVIEDEIFLNQESILLDKKLTDIPDLLEANKNEDFKYSKRIKQFKQFEKEYHANTLNYDFGENESTYFYKYNENLRIGFILLNDSWRCKTKGNFLQKESANNGKHYVGEQQVHNAINNIKRHDPNIIFCLMHHDLDMNILDGKEIEDALKRKNVNVILNGHYHKQQNKLVQNIGTQLFSWRCRASFNRPNETLADYKPGYQIFDMNDTSIIAVHYRMYLGRELNKFAPDVFTGIDDGIDKNKFNSNNGYELIRSKESTSRLNKEEFKRTDD